MKNKVLIIDDDKKLCDLLQRYLTEKGYDTAAAHDGRQGLRILKSGGIHLILLDVMMPGDDGFEVLKQIRKTDSVPVIMLTARGDTTDKIVGLRLGADDYLPKPFETAELEARVAAVLRRAQVKQKVNRVELGVVTIDLRKRMITSKEGSVELTQNEFRLLEYLIKNANIVITRSQITETLYGDEFDPFQRSVDILISRLRKKLKDDPKKPKYLKTMHGHGYMLVVDDDL